MSSVTAPLGADGAAEATAQQQPTEQPKDQTQQTKPEEKPEEPPVVTAHEVKVGGKSLRYHVTTGLMPIKNEVGETEARLFYMAYTLDSPEGDPKRPLMFSFNGGPGSSSVWLHLGALGPRRVRMHDEGWMPAPPFELVDNEHTWLDATDLVFIDPVDTGYSRATTPELAKQYKGVEKDIESVGEFIRLYLTRSRRWSSPLFLVGESYGTFRSAGLAGHLIERGVAFNGIVLVSSVLNMQTLRFTTGNDLPYVVYLPTYTATAWYHNRLPKDLQKQKLADLLYEVEQFAAGEYTLALGKGDAIPERERKEVVAKVARYTGLDEEYVDQTHLRIQIHRFCKELLRDEKRTVGRLDSRYTGLDAWGVTDQPDFDPSMAAIRPPFTAMLNDYVRRELNYENDAEYQILRGLDWDWGSAGDGHPDTSEALRGAFAKNQFLRLFVASGYYDLATPYFATEYTLSHMNLDPSLRDNVRVEEYPVGHMVYLEQKALAKLKSDVVKFVEESVKR
ncbi:MAG: S10 family peptidase [Thermomicrobiales bacterium]